MANNYRIWDFGFKEREKNGGEEKEIWKRADEKGGGLTGAVRTANMVGKDGRVALNR